MARLPTFNISWFYAAWLRFLIRYRQTFLGPIWIVISPALFILVIGKLYSHVGGHAEAILMPHLAAGLVIWTLISGFVTGSASVFPSNRAQIMQSGVVPFDIVLMSVFTTFLIFAHQVVVLAGVLVYFQVWPSAFSLLSLVGLLLLIVNGVWVTTVFGIIGARYRDLSEVLSAVMRIAFLATPIIWMADSSARGGLLGTYLLLNPFYHFLELVRAPLLGEQIYLSSWVIVFCITVLGSAFAAYFYRRFAKLVPLWI